MNITELIRRYRWISTDKNGGIYVYAKKPRKCKSTWRTRTYENFEEITIEQALLLCDRIPMWDDTEPTRVKR